MLGKASLDAILLAVRDQIERGMSALDADTACSPTWSLKGVAPHAAKWQQLAERESIVAGTLHYLSQQKMYAMLREIFLPRGSSLDLSAHLAMKVLIDPLETFDPKSSLDRVALSPVGLIHLYRQYFFELESFLGPSVQHIWLSPGATAELLEIHTRRELVERFVELESGSIAREERALTAQDELSDAVKNDNERNTKLGVSGSVGGGVDVGVFSAHAEVSTNYGIDTTERRAREQLHKQMRQQSSKLSTEIKRNFKSTFKTVTEVQDTTSKRYVLQNGSTNLVNYELRRKMRQVAIQLQDLGTQLCWQTYVDNPGRDLGVAQLVHIAEPPDLANLPHPEAPTRLDAQVDEWPIAFAYENTSGSDEKDVTFYKGSDKESGLNHNDTIVWVRDYKADPPELGYTLDENIDVTSMHTSTCVATATRLDLNGKYQIKLPQVNFDGQPAVNLKVKLRWNPPDQAAAEAEYKASLAKYDQEKSRLAKQAFVKAARERVKLASTVEVRDAATVREEERIAIYRKLIGALLDVGVNLENSKTRHVLSEVVNSMFDVDKMLYFVAPEWWRPRMHPSRQDIGDSDGKAPGVQRLTPEDVVSWGGANEGREDNYYITEDSRPARLGSSLGWLLQLDGDDMRNAFLNAPWVKAVIPIRPGKELAALNWLTHASVEGVDGLDSAYQAADAAEALAIVNALKGHAWSDPADKARYNAGFGAEDVTIKDALKYLAITIAKENEASNVVKSETTPLGETRSYMPADKVYDYGFEPLVGGFKATSAEPFEVFEQWVEILPTDQLVAVEVTYDPKTGFQV